MNLQNDTYNKLIHILYVPTLFCNLGCSYCYLGEQTQHINPQKEGAAIDTLRYAINKFCESKILPFNISLHGGEVTTLKSETLEELFKFIEEYYLKNKEILTANGFIKTNPHIKTNLYNFNKHIELFERYKVSVSASVDLPLSLHDKYRITKIGTSTIEKTLKNLKLLSDYKFKSKFSSVICYEHYLNIDEIIKDIWYIHNEIGFNMNNFNFMFGFEAKNNLSEKIENGKNNLRSLNAKEQLNFFDTMHKEFLNTELEEGLKKRWFEEFTPSYCTNSLNCGEKFFLLQFNGDIYSCVRGQGNKNFYYGNIYNNSVEEIMENAITRINIAHNNCGLDKECSTCEYLNICNTGCPFVKNEHNISKSYTCELQKKMYTENPEKYPPLLDSFKKKEYLNSYIAINHPQLMFEPLESNSNTSPLILTNELYEKKNSLEEIIHFDSILKNLYSDDSIKFEVNGQIYPMESQILKKTRPILMLKPSDSLRIHINKDLFKVNCNELVRNTFYIMMLRDSKVIYGDEKRVKQEHIFTHQVYYNILASNELNSEKFFILDVSGLFTFFSGAFIKGVLNNFFLTTSCMRDYHYQKHKENAFYHI